MSDSKSTQSMLPLGLILLTSHTGSIILRATYGYKASPKNDPYVELADRALRGLLYALIPGSYVVDYLPILKRVPCKSETPYSFRN